MLSFTTDQWVIIGLVFVLGLLCGGFLFSGGGRKWKARYTTEVDRRRELEATHSTAEKDWREQDSLRAAALKDRERVAAAAPVAVAPVVSDAEERRLADRREGDRRDLNHDGVITPDEGKPGLVDRLMGRDGTVDRGVDRDGDGVDDRRE